MKKVLIIIVIGVVLFLGLSSGELLPGGVDMLAAGGTEERITDITAAGVAAPTTGAGTGMARGGGIPTLTLIILTAIPTLRLPLTRMRTPRLRRITNRHRLPTGTTAGIPKGTTRTSQAARGDG